MTPETVQVQSLTPPSTLMPEVPAAEPMPRLRFWELDHCFKCPVVGMCITSAEQKHLIKKVGVSIKKKSPFELHEILVASSESKNRLSIRIDNLLARKYGEVAESLRGLDDTAFMTHFKTAFAAGDCVAILWAAVVNPQLPIKIKRGIFGEIHMAMHWNSEQSLMLKRRQSRLEGELQDLQSRLNAVSCERRAVQKENDILRQGNLTLQDELAKLKAENQRLAESGTKRLTLERQARLEAEQTTMADTIVELLERLKRQQRQMDALKKKNSRLRAEARRQKEAGKRIQAETESIIAEMKLLNRCDTSCPAFDLCKKRILIVGGVTRMETLYRELIEGNGGCFDYHDGYMKNGARRLESRLRRADVVLCPVSCNSHAACSLVKNLGKKHNKPVHMLPNSSLSTISQVIWGEQSGKVPLN